MTGGYIKRIISRMILGSALGLLLANWAMPSSAWNDPILKQEQKPVEQEKTAEQVYKNIQVFNGLPASQLDGVMQYMSAALGVGCTHCHINPWASDEKSAKLAARKMILMTRAINKDNFSGNPAITCYTCHRGLSHTTPTPEIDVLLRPEPEVVSPPPASLPTLDEMIDRYTKAIGGAAAIEKLVSRVARGNLITTNRMTQPLTVALEVYQQAPNKRLVITAGARGTSAEGFNGTLGWVNNDRGSRVTEGDELAGQKRDAELFRFINLRRSYPRMVVLGREKVAGREAYVVGATASNNSREKLYFDAATGLLIRQFVTFRTAMGVIPEVTDFDDYRDAGGLKLPFTISWSRAPFTATQRFSEIKINVAINDAKFERPAK